MTYRFFIKEYAMRQLLRNIIFFYRLMVEEVTWIKRCMKYNNCSKNKDVELYSLLIVSHVLEKGLTMPNRRLGFGQERVRQVLDLCQHCIEKYGAESSEVQSTLNDIEEYDRIHKEYSYDLPSDIQQKIDKILANRKSTKETRSLKFTSETFFEECHTFSEFAKSRHTCRHYSSKSVAIETIVKCIELAQSAPSACNRQSTRVYIISSEKGKDVVRRYQNGSRGFAEYADKFLLLTTDQYAWDIRQEKSGFIDAGIFTMNLLYALHEAHICACTLNAHLYSKNLKSFYKEMPIKKSEIPVLFISIGNASEEFSIARSERKEVENIYSIL